MPVTQKDLEDLIAKVEATPGWEVARHPTRWRITNTKGGGPLFVNFRPPKGNTLQPILTELATRGWDAQQSEMAAEEKRLRALEEDRESNERKMREAQHRMRQAELEALREQLAERDEELLAVRAGLAVDLGDGITKEVVDVDAGLARELLQYNSFYTVGEVRRERTPDAFFNRPLDMALVIHFRNTMLRGEWTQSHQGIAFDKNMRLLDGQHRLLAVIEADKIRPGITFRTEITYNLEPDVFGVVDAGKRRSTADVLALHDVPNRLVSASTTKLIHLFYAVPYSQWSKYRMTNQQTLELYPKYDALDGEPGQLATAVRVGSGLSKVITTPSASAAGFYVTSRAYPAADPQEFVWGLKTGENLVAGDPRLAYRRFADRLRASKRRTTTNVEQFALWIKAWNAWVEGTPMHQLVWRSNEPFPQPIYQARPGEYSTVEPEEIPEEPGDPAEG